MHLQATKGILGILLLVVWVALAPHVAVAGTGDHHEEGRDRILEVVVPRHLVWADVRSGPTRHQGGVQRRGSGEHLGLPAHRCLRQEVTRA